MNCYKKISIYTEHFLQMADCQPDEWISGLWFLVGGIVSVVTGCISFFVVGPLIGATRMRH